MAVSYEVYLTNDTGDDRYIVATMPGFDYIITYNVPGVINLGLPTVDFDLARIGLLNDQPDKRIEIWRSASGVSKRLKQLGVILKGDFSRDAAGKDNWRVTAFSPLEWARRRIIAYASGTSQAQKTSTEADDMAREVARENLGASATDTDRDITSLVGFTVQADQTEGPQISMPFAWKEMDKVLQDIAKASEEAGNRLYYTIAPLSSTAFQFQAWIDYPGIDRTTGGNPVIFSTERGNLKNPSLSIDYSNVINYVYSGGQGEAAARNVQEVEDTVNIARSVINRREGFANATRVPAGTLTEDAEIQDIGNAEIRENKPKRRFSGELLSTPQTLYDRDWREGDRVLVEYLGQKFVCVIESVRFAFAENFETITARVDIEE